MCGIAGFAGFDNHRLLEAMMDMLVHRGPDDEGFCSDEQVSLGMRRLSIIDVQGAMPWPGPSSPPASTGSPR